MNDENDENNSNERVDEGEEDEPPSDDRNDENIPDLVGMSHVLATQNLGEYIQVRVVPLYIPGRGEGARGARAGSSVGMAAELLSFLL